MVYNYWEKVVKKVVPEPGGGGVPEPRSIRVTPVLGEGGVPEPRKEDPLKRLGGEAESIKRRCLLPSLAGRSWSGHGLEGVQDAGIEQECFCTARRGGVNMFPQNHFATG